MIHQPVGKFLALSMRLACKLVWTLLHFFWNNEWNACNWVIFPSAERAETLSFQDYTGTQSTNDFIREIGLKVERPSSHKDWRTPTCHDFSCLQLEFSCVLVCQTVLSSIWFCRRSNGFSRWSEHHHHRAQQDYAGRLFTTKRLNEFLLHSGHFPWLQEAAGPSNMRFCICAIVTHVLCPLQVKRSSANLSFPARLGGEHYGVKEKNG